MVMENHRKKMWAAGITLLCANILFFLTIWLIKKYDDVHIEQCLYQLKTSSSGADSSLVFSALFFIGILAPAITGLELLFYRLLSGKAKRRIFTNNEKYQKYRLGKMCEFFKCRPLLLSLLVLGLSVTGLSCKMDLVAYAENALTHSAFIETHYVDPELTKISFPEKKRNLIYIYLESMESTYADTGAGECIKSDYIPELSRLAENSVNFSNTDSLGGALSFTGTTWTAASMVSQTSGVPVKTTLTGESFGGENSYLPGLKALGDILSEQGYQQVILMGSDAEFANRDTYFTEHGAYRILDIDALKRSGRLPEDYRVWWGFEDEKLFSFAKEELNQLGKSGQPFNFTMLTADTHFPDGYTCRLCEEKFDRQYANVLACSSRQVSDFVSWIKKQPFYENTTIVISGDHLTMDPNFLKDIDENYVRTVYNCIINAPVQAVQEKNRKFGVFDMFPTTIASLGAKIEGDRLGLGTNLFSEQQTWTELYGFETLNKELQRYSDYYESHFVYKKADR